MKKTIETILSRGYTTTKKPIEEFTNYLYILKYILKVNEVGRIMCNNNCFWSVANKKNRMQLIHDISLIRRKSINDNSYFHIINRFENGDKYGIEI